MGCGQSRHAGPGRPLDMAPYFEEEEGSKSVYGKGTFWSSDRTAIQSEKLSKIGVASSKSRTLSETFQMAAKNAGDKIAMRVEHGLAPPEGRTVPPALPLDEWKSWTFQQYYDECRLVGRAFMALGMDRFDGCNIYGFNSPEWFMGEMGAILAGGCAAGIYPTDTPEQVIFKSSHSGASIAVVENDKHVRIFRQGKEAGKLPKLKAIVVWAPSADFVTESTKDLEILHWNDLKERAEKVSDQELDERITAQQSGNVCAYIYTSGTTGNPKAVMITHDNILWASTTVLDMLKNYQGVGSAPEEERIVSYLPLSHVAGMMVDIVCPIVSAAIGPAWVSANFARPYDIKFGTVGDRLRAVRPTLFIGVPRVWEKIADTIKAKGAATKGLKLKIARWAKGKGLQYQKNMQLGGSGEVPGSYGRAESLVLSKVKQALGLDQCKFGFTGAAPIMRDTLEYFGSLGIQINEVYGMSECCGATTFSVDKAHVWGSCGWAMPGTEVKIFKVDPSDLNKKTECPMAKDMFNATEEEQGEICYRGRHIMAGYMANPDMGPEHVREIEKKNADAIDDEGWLHSGDKGCISTTGMVKITGRYKELIIGAGGENVAPVPIEDNIKTLCPAISNVLMLGDKRKFNVCVITLKAKGANGDLPGGDELDGPALKVNGKVTTISAAMKDDTFISMIEKAIVDTNNNGEVCPSNACKIQKFSILPLDFSITTGEFTPTFKLKRSVVTKQLESHMDKMYDSKETYVPYEPAE